MKLITIEYLNGAASVLQMAGRKLTKKNHLIAFSIQDGKIRADDYEGELCEKVDPEEADMSTFGPYSATPDGVYDLFEIILLTYISTYKKK